MKQPTPTNKALLTATQGIIEKPRIVRLRLHPQIYDWSYLGLRDIKRSLQDFLAKHAPNQEGLIVADLGCGNAPYKSLFNRVAAYHGIDVYPGSAVTIKAPIWKTTLPDTSVDIIVCTEVLEHTRYTRETINEMHRILKPGGITFITIPFLYPVHSDDDQWRFTLHGLKDLFGEDFDTIVQSLGGPWTTVSQLIAVVLQSFPLGRYIFMPVFFVLNLGSFVANFLTRLLIACFRFMPEKQYQQIRFSTLEALPHHYVVIAKRK